MKYTKSMFNRFLASLIILFSAFAFGQTTSNNPYSSLGLGERGGFDHGFFSGAGNNRVIFCDSTVLNFYNPASYSHLTSHNPLFSLGISSRLSQFSQGGSSYNSGLTSLDHFAFGSSFAKVLGFGVGLKPFSRRGYSITETYPFEGDSIQYSYSGSGSINQAFLGLSSYLIKFKGLEMTVGANASYVFGTTLNVRSSELVSKAGVGGIDHKELNVQSFYYDLGLHLKYQLKKNQHLAASLTYEPEQSLNAVKNQTVFFSQNINDESTFLELSSTGDIKGKIVYPSQLASGLLYKYQFKGTDAKGNSRTSEIVANVGFHSEQWSTFRGDFDSSSFTSNYLNSGGYSLGLTFTPEIQYLLNSSTTTFLERVSYRVGAYTKTLPYALNTSDQVSDKGLTLGFGIPFTVGNSLSSVQFGASVGKRGPQSKDALQEKYMGLNFGIIIAPTRSDRWFVKRKLD